MQVLLDTHAFLWWVTNDSQLSQTAKDTIANPANTVLFSVINGWEIVIKQGTGKLTLPEPAATYIPSLVVQKSREGLIYGDSRRETKMTRKGTA